MAPISILCTPSSGTVFPMGRTQVSCVAADAQNRSDTCTFAVTVQLVAQLSATRIVAFGDSITAGSLSPCGATSSTFGPLSFQEDLRLIIASIDVPSSYPAKLQTQLRARYTTQQPTVFNEGVGGERVEMGATRLPGVLSADRAQALLLQEGINNLNAGDPASAVVNGLRTMVRQARGMGIPVLLGTLLPERAGACRAYAVNAVPPANDQIRSMAAAEGALVVDLYQTFNGKTDTLLGPDGLHPNETGYDAIAQTFFDAIRQSLEGVPRQP
jgi:lysophospholipase L1-like esterase